MRPMCQRKAQHRHCFRLMDLQLSSVGTRKCTGRNVVRLVRRNVLVLRWSSRVCRFLLRVFRVWERMEHLLCFPALAYYLIRQPMPPPSQSQGDSHVKLQKHNGTYWLHADRRVTVDDKSATHALAGFSSVQMAPIQEGGAATSSDMAVAEPLPNSAEAGRVSREAVPIEQEQPLRAVEPNEWAMKVRAKPIPETPTQRRRDIHELTHLPPVLWRPA